MGVISWIILGLIAGFIGSKIVNKTGSGMIMDIVLGIVGAIVGGLIFSGIFGMTGVTGLNIWSLIVAIVGAVILRGGRGGRAIVLRDALRFGNLADSSMVATRVGEVRTVVVAAPGYLRKHPRLEEPSDLALSAHDRCMPAFFRRAAPRSRHRSWPPTISVRSSASPT